jgi:hypothetical protein
VVVDEVVGVDRDRPDAGEERKDELDTAHRTAAEVLTARTYPVGDPGVGVDRTSAPSCDTRAGAGLSF